MARPRKPRQRQSAYERRIQSYLRRHPGATRQEARGHRPPKGRTEHAERVRRAQARGATRAEAQGKAGRAAFLAYIRDGDLIQMSDHIKNVDVDARGRFVRIEKLVVPVSERRRERRFVIRNLTRDQLRQMIEDEEASGGNLTIAPSLDQRRLLRV